MNTESTSIFDLAAKRLQWLSTRQKVVAENIVNADVSEYRAKDIESFASYLNDSKNSNALGDAEVVESSINWQADRTGNNVILEDQIMEANANAGQFRIAANLYRKAHEMIYTVAGRR